MRETEIQCRLPRVLLQAFVDRAAGLTQDRHLAAARNCIARLLSTEPDSSSVAVSGSIDGFISILQFIARDVAKDVRARRPATLAALGQILTPIVSRQQFPPQAEPKFSREVATCFEF